MQQSSQLSIVIPCYNPPLDWQSQFLSSYRKIKTLLKETSIEWILVNDGSTIVVNPDSLKKEIKNFNFISYKKNKGKGYALKTGVSKTTSKIVVYTDIDFPYLEENLVQMYNVIKNEKDVCVGHRNNSYYLGIPTIRKYISLAFKWFVKKLFKISIADTQAGLKAFSKKGKKVFLECETNGYLIDLEFIKKSESKGLKIAEIPITLKPNVVLNQMSLSVLQKELSQVLKILLKT